MRDITGATCTFNVSNTLFAASNTNYKVFNSATVAPSNVYISTPWGEYEKIWTGFTGRVVEVCAKQGDVVNKGVPRILLWRSVAEKLRI